LTCSEITPEAGRVYIYNLKSLNEKPSYISGPYNNPLLISDDRIAILKEKPLEAENQGKTKNQIFIDIYSIDGKLLTFIDLNY
jgi:hypothetical protein